MLLEILSALREGVVAVIKSAIDTCVDVFKSFVKAFVIFRDSVSSTSPLEIFIVLVIFGFIGYMTFKLFVENARDFAKYIVILIFFFILTLMML